MAVRLVRAEVKDAAILAQMNKRLIEDEGHPNPMKVSDLEKRMRGWLRSRTFEGVLFALAEETVGYALYRLEPEWVYVRHFYVDRPFRRRGVGRQALAELERGPWNSAHRVRLDVLTGNPAGIAFWRACGFVDYALTLERVRAPGSGANGEA